MYASRNTDKFWRKPLAIDNGVGKKLTKPICVTVESLNEAADVGMGATMSKTLLQNIQLTSLN